MLNLLNEFTPASVSLVVAFAGVIVWWIRGMPARELAKIEGLKARGVSDASLRTDLMRRIGELERQLTETHTKCHEEQEALRGELRTMQQRFDGVVRQFITYQLHVAQAIPPEQKSEHINKMLESLQPLLVHQFPDQSEDSEEAKPGTV